MVTQLLLSVESLEDEAARTLAEASAIVVRLRGREPRERHRRLLDDAMGQAELALAQAPDANRANRARSILARAHAARAEDALHGAGQLSLSAQRAPTRDACDEGWRRVESIVAFAEEASRAAGMAAGAMAGDSSSAARAARAAAARAAAAAPAARNVLEDRNQAYTFHTDFGFSFGEGWYLAAAAVLGGVLIQIEPGKAGTVHAERFLRDAGLHDRLRPHRSRPRANKQTTEIVARAFRADARGALQRLRGAFLGDAPIAPAVRSWIDPRLSGSDDRPKVLLWIRAGGHAHQPGRNTVSSEVVALVRIAGEAGLVPILVGDALPDGAVPAGAVDMIFFWKDPVFRGEDTRRAQLQFFEHLRSAHHVIGQVGVTTAGMDGPALMGMPTMYLTDASNVRMREWVGAVPGYREVVREPGYLERVKAGLVEWVARAPRSFKRCLAPTSSEGLR